MDSPLRDSDYRRMIVTDVAVALAERVKAKARAKVLSLGSEAADVEIVAQRRHAKNPDFTDFWIRVQLRRKHG